MAANAGSRGPILLLKTRSVPEDTYEDYFSAAGYEPVFVPVLEHIIKKDAMAQVRQYIRDGAFLPAAGLPKYGGIIFTSQRAVEAFAELVAAIRKEDPESLHRWLPASVPLYAVGPATARGLRGIGLPCPVIGEESGTGEVLSSVILEHYNNVYNGPSNPAILFLVGDKRRDIIPKTLQSPSLPAKKQIPVHELVVYETGEMHSFKTNFAAIYQDNLRRGQSMQWIVVFSPTGCRAMLEGLGVLDEQTGRVRPGARVADNVHVATIGPTTRDYLLNQFGFSPDVCADAPSAEGVGDGIRAFFGS
ncbi:uroporphyrinogen-III synthase-like protein [Sporormia fimetaria CBS 119925]|uniref:Uroporphyrinogen-III synthase-like protein n=1 Tax=Sporormia fimetaria CBS 119925 TaxID=1340428 RepID=A0A6A6V8D2_9PLEO|nr:uroporphyrinogen-III synthase-like protein [Sporormia fimetaria CBS 119925]